MKKLFLYIGWIVILSGCSKGEVRLPNLEGQSQNEIEVIFQSLELTPNFIERSFIIEDQSNQFIEYGMFLQVGDAVEKGSVIPVIVSARLIDSSLFFVPSELVYDGPRLSDSFFDFELAIQRNNQIIGLGGAFYTQLANNGCVDGDTARFVMPDEMLPFTEERVMRTRFFNFDSPETFRGGEEEFGMPASLYACELLENASSIVLQTDPGDNLFDRFGRLLAWIWVQFDEEPFELLNYWMVRQGLGEVRYLFGAGETSVTVYDDLTYTEWMFLGEQRAQDDSLGIHGDLYDYYWDYTNNRPNPFARP